MVDLLSDSDDDAGSTERRPVTANADDAGAGSGPSAAGAARAPISPAQTGVRSPKRGIPSEPDADAPSPRRQRCHPSPQPAAFRDRAVPPVDGRRSPPPSPPSPPQRPAAGGGRKPPVSRKKAPARGPSLPRGKSGSRSATSADAADSEPPAGTSFVDSTDRAALSRALNELLTRHSIPALRRASRRFGIKEPRQKAAAASSGALQPRALSLRAKRAASSRLSLPLPCAPRPEPMTQCAALALRFGGDCLPSSSDRSDDEDDDLPPFVPDWRLQNAASLLWLKRPAGDANSRKARLIDVAVAALRKAADLPRTRPNGLTERTRCPTEIDHLCVLGPFLAARLVPSPRHSCLSGNAALTHNRRIGATRANESPVPRPPPLPGSSASGLRTSWRGCQSTSTSECVSPPLSASAAPALSPRIGASAGF